MKGIEYYREESFDMIEIKTCCDDLHAYKSHLHQELSIGYITKGSTFLTINEKEYYIEAGEAVIIYPLVSHKCQPVDINNWEFTMIYIDDEFCKGIFDNLVAKNSIGLKKLSNDEFEQIKHLADFIKSDASHLDKAVELINTLSELFIKCDIDMFIQFQSSKKMNSIKKYIEDHFLNNLHLKDMEDEFNINKFSLIRNFKRKFNTTPNAYQLQLKVDYGKKLLKGSSDIVDIAIRASFYDQAHFTKEFKKAYGITPLQYYKSIH
ncbi:AraC family transcriptional regulator [Clostridium sediminicola]|uniref:AraC family transcriptional regulator n=1 Tax=Clostridium sediminicola TaxID=3114879 RepID=UPI0031F20A53